MMKVVGDLAYHSPGRHPAHHHLAYHSPGRHPAHHNRPGRHPAHHHLAQHYLVYHQKHITIAMTATQPTTVQHDYNFLLSIHNLTEQQNET